MRLLRLSCKGRWSREVLRGLRFIVKVVGVVKFVRLLRLSCKVLGVVRFVRLLKASKGR